ncbi:MAG: acetyltransferase, partial [Hydrogenovibrio sp.]|nr:acetyltransferase [Hydrogenovibrio sp.]
MVETALLLIGGGGHARSVMDVIEAHQGYRIAGVVEANPAIESVGGYSVLGQDPDLPGLVKKTPHCLITLGQIDSGQVRQILFEKALQIGAQFPVLVSP